MSTAAAVGVRLVVRGESVILLLMREAVKRIEIVKRCNVPATSVVQPDASPHPVAMDIIPPMLLAPRLTDSPRIVSILPPLLGRRELRIQKGFSVAYGH